MKVYDSGNDKFIKCFSMELKSEELKATSIYANIGRKKRFRLYLSLSFNDQQDKLLKEHTVKFGLKGGELNLRLKQCEMALANCEMGRKLDLETIVGEAIESASGGNATIEISNSPRATYTKTNHTKIEDRFTYTKSIVSVYGSSENRTWVFESPTVLKGAIYEKPLGIIEINGYPCYADATFRLQKKDICVVSLKDSRGNEIADKVDFLLWGKTKYSVFETKIAEEIGIETDDFYISRVRLRNDR